MDSNILMCKLFMELLMRHMSYEIDHMPSDWTLR